MIARPLSPEEARALAHRVGICQELVGQAVARHAKTGHPVATLRAGSGSDGPDHPPRMVFVVVFSHGFSDASDNGWNGLTCSPITDQRDLNAAKKLVEELVGSICRNGGEKFDI